jgi:hypothetical protein
VAETSNEFCSQFYSGQAFGTNTAIDLPRVRRMHFLLGCDKQRQRREIFWQGPPARTASVEACPSSINCRDTKGKRARACFTNLYELLPYVYRRKKVVLNFSRDAGNLARTSEIFPTVFWS